MYPWPLLFLGSLTQVLNIIGSVPNQSTARNEILSFSRSRVSNMNAPHVFRGLVHQGVPACSVDRCGYDSFGFPVDMSIILKRSTQNADDEDDYDWQIDLYLAATLWYRCARPIDRVVTSLSMFWDSGS